MSYRREKSRENLNIGKPKSLKHVQWILALYTNGCELIGKRLKEERITKTYMNGKFKLEKYGENDEKENMQIF